MSRKVFVFLIILASALLLYGQDSPTVTIKGYLIDNACTRHADKEVNYDEQVRKHKTSCALMLSCVRSGFAVFSEGKLYRLDETGNKSALDLLKSTTTKDGFLVVVEGRLEGEVLRVTKITEVKATTE